jgi:hypothetical protein
MTCANCGREMKPDEENNHDRQGREQWFCESCYMTLNIPRRVADETEATPSMSDDQRRLAELDAEIERLLEEHSRICGELGKVTRERIPLAAKKNAKFEIPRSNA